MKFGRYEVNDEGYDAEMQMQRYRITFGNGFGASIIQGPYSYGGPEGLWELAVLGPDGRLTYDTPITEDVEGRLTDIEVAALLTLIEALPKEDDR